MKILLVLVLVLSLVIVANTQVLTGTVYDAQGALIPKVKAINEKGKVFETETNDEGIYSLNLPFNDFTKISSKQFKISKYEIVVECGGFEKNILKDFKFISAYPNEMILDVSLDGANPEPCGYSGADCLPDLPEKIESNNSEISNKISEQALEKKPKAKIIKRKNNK